MAFRAVAAALLVSSVQAQCDQKDTQLLTSCGAGSSSSCSWMVEHPSNTNAVAFTPAGKVATGSDDGARIFTDAGVFETKLACADFAVYDLAFTSTHVAIAGAGGKAVVCTVAGDLVFTIQDIGGTVPVRHVAFTEDSNHLVVSGAEGKWTHILDVVASLAQAKPVVELSVEKRARVVAFSRDGAYLATATGTEVDEVLTVWKTSSGAKVAEIPSVSARVSSISFPASGNELLRGMTNGDVVVTQWSGATIGEGDMSEKVKLSMKSKVSNDADFSPSSVYMGAVGEGEVVLWNAAGTETTRLMGHSMGSVSRLAFSKVGAHMATVSTGGVLIFWDLSSTHPFLHSTP